MADACFACRHDTSDEGHGIINWIENLAGYLRAGISAVRTEVNLGALPCIPAA
jgi:hypothetical protein